MATVAAAGWVLLVSSASAQAEVEGRAIGAGEPSLVLEYSAPAACPDREAWQARVAARLAGGATPSGAERLDQVVAKVIVSASGEEAQVVFREQPGAGRVVSGRNCDEVLSAAALIVAVALGAGATPPAQGAAERSRAFDDVPQGDVPHSDLPQGDVPQSDLPQSDLPEGAAVRREATEPLRGGAAPAKAKLALPARSTKAVSSAVVDTPRSGGSERRWGFALGAAAEANNWLGPWPVAVFDVSVEAFAPARQWSARLAASYGSAQAGVGERQADFTFWVARLDVCPIALEAASGWRWVSCAEAWLGLLRGAGDESSALETGFEATAAWAGMAATTRLQTPALGAFRFEAELGLSLPFWKREFRFKEPEEVVFESPALGVLGRAGIQVALGGEPSR